MNRLLGRSEEGCHFNRKVCDDVDLCSGRETNSPSLYFKTKKKYLFNQTVLGMGGRVISCDEIKMFCSQFTCVIPSFTSQLMIIFHLSTEETHIGFELQWNARTEPLKL